MSLSREETHAAIVLASLPAMTPQRLRSLVYGRRPTEAVSAIRSWPRANSTSSRSAGPLEALLASRSFRAHSRTRGRSLGEIWNGSLDEITERVARDSRERQSRGSPVPFDVCILGHDDYPRELAVDPHAPGVLFTRGERNVLSAPRVAIVGTRHATAHGRSFARQLGDVLCGHGVAVVSGLARGVDVSAHRGVLTRLDRGPSSSGGRLGAPIGVVASGLDVVYPPEHCDIWCDVANRGLLMSESPPGTEPQAFRFPLRNRIIAALCNVLVVVESRATGGSMITVREALARGVTVMAVPGATTTRSAEGTNQLIRDGASIVVEPEDVLAVLGLEACRRYSDFDPRPRPTAGDCELLDIMGAQPMTLDHVVAATRRDLADVALALGRLEATGWVMCTAGWFERLALPGE